MIRYLSNKLVTVVEEKLTKDEIIKLLVNNIDKNTDVVLKKEDFLDRIEKREDLGTTGIGMGIVVPHAKTNSVKGITISVALLKHKIDFNTPDGIEASLVLLVGAPRAKEYNKEYLDLLSNIARFFRKKECREAVLTASNKEELIEALSEF